MSRATRYSRDLLALALADAGIAAPMRTALIGFGQGVIYLVRTDDDRQNLQRDPWP
jgi:hypothetical protein